MNKFLQWATIFVLVLITIVQGLRITMLQDDIRNLESSVRKLTEASITTSHSITTLSEAINDHSAAISSLAGKR